MLGLTTAGIGVLWLVGRSGPAGGAGEQIYEQRLLRNSKEGLYEIFDISQHEVIIGYKRDATMSLERRVRMLAKEVKPFADLQRLYNELELATTNPADLEVQVTAVEVFFQRLAHDLTPAL